MTPKDVSDIFPDGAPREKCFPDKKELTQLVCIISLFILSGMWLRCLEQQQLPCAVVITEELKKDDGKIKEIGLLLPSCSCHTST